MRSGTCAAGLWRVCACLAGAIAILVLLSGCASPGVAAPEAAANNSDNAFALTGRVSVRYGDESLSGRIDWAHSIPRDEISLASPLGNQLAVIVRDAAGVSLTDASRTRFEAADAETLTERRLGWRLPLAGLADWVRARPGAKATVRADARGRPEHVSDEGWNIEFAYEGDASLPRRLILVYTRAERPLEIRLVVDNWM